MLETKKIIFVAEFARIDGGETPSMALRKIVTRPDGGQKSIAMTIPVPDAALLARAGQELRDGDQIEVEIETRWGEKDIPKSLLGFSRVAAAQGRMLAAAGG